MEKVVRIVGELRNSTWWVNEDYIELIEKSQDDNYLLKRIAFDLSDCTWIDPLPALSILLIAKTFRTNGVRVEIICPPIDSPEKRRRVTYFLKKEDFFTEKHDDGIQLSFDSIQVGTKVATSLNEFEIYTEELDENIPKLTYIDSTIIKFLVLDTNSIGNDETKSFDKYVAELIEPKLFQGFKEIQVDQLVYKTKLLLDETLHNIYKHAYQNGLPKLAGIFIRKRFGLQQDLPEDSKEPLITAFQNEEDNCPRLDQSYADDKNAFLEVFVLDHGCGIEETWGKTKEKRPELYTKIFKTGERGAYNKKRGLSEHGGLHNIYHLLSNNQDYIWLKSSDNTLRVNFLSEKNPIQNHDLYRIKESAIPGVAWNFRISSSRSIQIDKKNFYSKRNCTSIEKHPIWESYHDQSNFEENIFEGYPVYDHRYFIPSKLRNSGNSNPQLSYPYNFIFPPHIVSKYGVYRIINESSNFFLPVTSGKTNRNKILFILDIPEFNTNSYLAALDGASFNKDKYPRNSMYRWIWNYKKIYLITQGLRVAIINIKSNTKAFTLNREKKVGFLEDYFSKTEPATQFNPEMSFESLLKWLRFHDSFKFWDTVSDLNLSHNYFLPKKIEWNEIVKSIDGYLNIDQVLSNSELKGLLKNSLKRTLCVDKKTPEFFPVDVLVKDLCVEMNHYSRNIFSTKNQNQSFQLASVHVTGEVESDPMTLLKLENAERHEKGDTAMVRFFCHSSSLDFPPSIFIWPNKAWFESKGIRIEEDKKSNYKRVGSSHVIARDGWKYFNVPRYIPPDGESFYKRPPKKAYDDIQSSTTQILKIGNFNYQRGSDLYKIDIEKAVALDFYSHGPLSSFLLLDFLFAIYQGDYRSENFKNILKAFLSDGSINPESLDTESPDFIERSDFYRNVIAVVYPVHHKSSFIVRKIKNRLSSLDLEEQQLNELKEKIIPLTPLIQEAGGGSMYISPLLFDRIEELIDLSTHGKDIVIFDDVFISGRTNSEITFALKHIGAENVKSLIALDRSRLPMSTPDPMKFRAYWRFDIPRLSQRGLNPINITLDNIKSEIPIQNPPSLAKRIEKLNYAWRSKHMFEDEDGIGLSPIPIYPVDKRVKKKFGLARNEQGEYSQYGNDENRISIHSSTGLSMWISEMQSITGRNDLITKVLQHEEFPKPIMHDKKIEDSTFINFDPTEIKEDERHNLNKEVRIELICVHLLLYRKSLSNKLISELLIALFIDFVSLKKSDSYSALALIVLCYFEAYKISLINDLIIGYLGREGLIDDCILFFLYAYKKQGLSKDQRVYLFDVFFGENTSISSIEIHLIHKYIRIEDPNPSAHFDPFRLFCEIQKPDDSGDKYYGFLRDVLRGVEILKLVLNKIQPHEAHLCRIPFDESFDWDQKNLSGKEINTRKGWNLSTLQEHCKLIADRLSRTIQQHSRAQKLTLMEHQEIKENISELALDMQVLLSNYSIPCYYHPRKKKMSIVLAIEELFGELSKGIHDPKRKKDTRDAIEKFKNTTYGIRVPKRLHEDWAAKNIDLPFNFGASEYLINLLSNALHISELKTSSPFNSKGYSTYSYSTKGFIEQKTDKATQWVQVVYSGHHLKIYISNRIEEPSASPESIFEQINQKHLFIYSRAKSVCKIDLVSDSNNDPDLTNLGYKHKKNLFTVCLTFRIRN